MKSVELMMCVPDFPIRGFSSWARKRKKSYVGEFMVLTIVWEDYQIYVLMRQIV